MRKVILLLVSIFVLVGVDIYTTTELNRLRMITAEKEQVQFNLSKQLEYSDSFIDILTERITTLEKQNEVLIQELQIWQSFGKGAWSIEIIPSRTQ